MDTTTLPKLTALGQELDTGAAAFGELRPSDDIAYDAEAMCRRMAEDGYLYLPGYLDRDDVLEARRFTAERLAEAGWIDSAYPIMDMVAVDNPTAPRPDFVQGNEALRRVLYEGAMMEHYDRLLGGPATHFDFTWTRAMQPERGTPPHCDIVYMGRGSLNLYTSWTPLGDVPYEIGGLMILEKSHRIERLRATYCRKDVDEYCSNRYEQAPPGEGGGGNIAEGGWLSWKPVKLRENLGGRWLTAKFRAGDLLCFSAYTVHASLDNHSDYIRVSADSRYQLASEPIDERWMGDDPIGRRQAYKRGRVC